MLELSAHELAQEIAARRVSPVEVLSAVLLRLDETEPLLNAWISRRDGEAMIEAQQAEREIQQGTYRGPLHGIPIGVKDNISVAGTITTAGSRVLAENLTTEDAESVRRLRAAGAIVVGKTNLHEFAYGATTINSHFGSTHNPWYLGRIASGSSGGSAAAVAARQVPLAIGTDAAGSIRMPASVCGIVGVKATFGRVSTWGLLASHNPTVDHVGPMARTVHDAALMLDVMAGPDPRDPNASIRPVDAYASSLDAAHDLRGLRVGIPTNFFFDLVDPDVERVVRAAIDELQRLGAELVEVALPDLEEMVGLRLALFADGTAFHGPHLRAHPEQYGEDIRHRLLVDHFVGAHDYARATRVRRLLQARFATAFREVDLIAAPGTAVAAFSFEQELVRLRRRQSGDEVTIPGQLLLLRVTAPGNLVGIPALSVPAGFTPEGCPVGLQLMGRPFEETTLLRAAHVYEQATRYFERVPPLAVPN